MLIPKKIDKGKERRVGYWSWQERFRWAHWGQARVSFGRTSKLKQQVSFEVSKPPFKEFYLL